MRKRSSLLFYVFLFGSISLGIFYSYLLGVSNKNLSLNSSAAVGQNRGSVYLLGDSITEGMVINGANNMFAQKGFRLTANGKISRSLGGATNSGLEEMKKAEVRNKIKTSKFVVVELGTNPSNGFREDAVKIINDIRGLNPDVKLFWVNIGSSHFAPIYGETNCILNNLSRTKDFVLIDWFHKVFPGKDECHIPAGINNTNLLSGDGIHPNSTGSKALINLIINSLPKDPPNPQNTKTPTPTATKTPPRATKTPPPLPNCANLNRTQCDARDACKWFFCNAGGKDDKCARADKTREEVCGPKITQSPPPRPSVSKTPPPKKTPSPSTSPRPSGGPQDLVLNLKLSFQGILKKPNAQDKMRVKVVINAPGAIFEAICTDGQNSGSCQRDNMRVIEFTADDKGFWTGAARFRNIKSRNDYFVLIKGPKHLQKRVCDTKPTETAPGTYHCIGGHIALAPASTKSLDFGGIKQLVGDLPLPTQDGIVDSQDISFIRNNLSSKDPKVLTAADLNLDGIVDTQDYSLLIASLSIRFDEK